LNEAKFNEMKFQFSIITLIAPKINEAKHKRKPPRFWCTNCIVTALGRWRH